MSSKPVPPDYWPCACVKRDRQGNLKALKMNPPMKKYCRACGCVRPPKNTNTGGTP